MRFAFYLIFRRKYFLINNLHSLACYDCCLMNTLNMHWKSHEKKRKTIRMDLNEKCDLRFRTLLVLFNGFPFHWHAAKVDWIFLRFFFSSFRLREIFVGWKKKKTEQGTTSTNAKSLTFLFAHFLLIRCEDKTTLLTKLWAKSQSVFWLFFSSLLNERWLGRKMNKNWNEKSAEKIF